jgi:hypothetical protein
MKNQFWAVGHWSGLDCEIKGSGQLLRPFVFLLFRHSVRTEKLHIKKVKKKFFGGGRFFFFRKTIFFSAKI